MSHTSLILSRRTRYWCKVEYDKEVKKCMAHPVLSVKKECVAEAINALDKCIGSKNFGMKVKYPLASNWKEPQYVHLIHFPYGC